MHVDESATLAYHSARRELHTEEHLFGRHDATIGLNGQASKDSPILREGAARLQGKQALEEPVHSRLKPALSKPPEGEIL